MKNIIKYYYDLDVSYIRQTNDNYFLTINNNNYLFCKCDLKELENNIKYLNNNLSYHKLISTKNGLSVVNYNGNDYALFKINTLSKIANMNDILNSIQPIYIKDNNIKEKWIRLWEEYVDYIEYQNKELNKKDSYISKIANYYIGLAENSIEFLKNIDITNVPYYLVHKRVKYNTNLIELYNPCYIRIDTKVRDMAEYDKSIFFYTNISYNEFMNMINEQLSILNNDELKLFYARLLYPSYFLDLYDEFIKDKYDKDSLNLIISKSSNYEKALKNIIDEIKKRIYIIDIDWLNQLY